MLIEPIEVDRHFRWRPGTARRLARRGKLPHVLDPSGEILFTPAIMHMTEHVPARCRRCGCVIERPPFCVACREGEKDA